MKYTVIYDDYWMAGSHMRHGTRMLRIEQQDGETVDDMLERENVLDRTQLLFVGWPLLQGEEGVSN